MNTDIRLMLSFQSHPKTKKLRLKLGNEAVLSFIWLMMFAAANKPDGILDGMDEEDIALAADWGGDSGEFVEVLVAVRYLEWHDQDTLRIHDWEDNNPWAAGADARSERAKKAADARWGKADEKVKKQQHNGKSDAASMHEHSKPHADSNAKSEISNAPSPSPSPSPIPAPPLSNDGDKTNVSSRAEEKLPPPNTASANFSDFKPDDSTIQRIRMRFKEIPDKFIQDEIPGFLIYAEGNYQRRQLQGKFYENVVRHWQMKDASPPPDDRPPGGSAPGKKKPRSITENTREKDYAVTRAPSF